MYFKISNEQLDLSFTSEELLIYLNSLPKDYIFQLGSKSNCVIAQFLQSKFSYVKLKVRKSMHPAIFQVSRPWDKYETYLQVPRLLIKLMHRFYIYSVAGYAGPNTFDFEYMRESFDDTETLTAYKAISCVLYEASIHDHHTCDYKTTCFY